MGTSDDKFVSYVEEPQESDFSVTDNDSASGAGTTKRKELHGTTSICGLSASWANKLSDVVLNAYRIKFVCKQIGKNYCGFVLLVEATLDDDITRQEIDLFLHKNKVVKTSISLCGQVHLNAKQVEKSKLFQELLFNGLFGRLFVGSRSSGSPREFLLKDGKELVWSSSNMYLLLPMEPASGSSPDPFNIYWKGIDACVSVVEALRNIHSDSGYFTSPLRCSQNLSQTNCEGSDTIHMADKSININALKGMVVLAIHTGRIYCIFDVLHDKSAESPFDKVKGKRLEFNSFVDYYRKKYNIELQHPKQSLLLVKQSYHPHNLLILPSKSKDGSMTAERAQVHIPPELLVDLSMSPEVLRSFYLLPSVMHRLASMMLASQLCKYIGCSHISSILILEAITTLRCCDNFSYERLELLGDSVLKYAVSCNLFLKYPMKHEGQLSEHRSREVCNSTLHKLGIGRSLQGYIRDSAFDPRRWLAPGQIPLHPLPCKCGLDTSEVPLRREYLTEDTNIVLGKTCDRGHRWMCSRTIADCVEALIGAYYIGGGLNAAISLMSWLGMDVAFEPLLIEEAKRNASLCWCHLRASEIDILESKLNYMFSVKGLLLEAITHPSRESESSHCYQRLEFLGDAVLDLLITCYLHRTHTSIDPGELTDLRSASVSNENFAQTTVRHSLHHHLQHASEVLSGQIIEYVSCILKFGGDKSVASPLDAPKGPKVLGDILESIAGAILIDTNLDLNIVWGVFQPLLSPIVTPDNLELPPLRELLELCSGLGYPINTVCTSKEEMVIAELSVQLEDDLLVRSGCDAHRKSAKAQAALRLLKDLKERGISLSQQVSKRRPDLNSNGKSVNSCKDHITLSLENDTVGAILLDKQNVSRPSTHREPSIGLSLEENCPLDDLAKNTKEFKKKESVAVSIKMEKGGPRTALFELCRIFQWPMPRFECTEEKFRKQISVNGVLAFNKYTSSIVLHVPDSLALELEGEPRADKKSSRDSAALAMLQALKKQGKCIITDYDD